MEQEPLEPQAAARWIEIRLRTDRAAKGRWKPWSQTWDIEKGESTITHSGVQIETPRMERALFSSNGSGLAQLAAAGRNVFSALSRSVLEGVELTPQNLADIRSLRSAFKRCQDGSYEVELNRTGEPSLRRPDGRAAYYLFQLPKDELDDTLTFLKHLPEDAAFVMEWLDSAGDPRFEWQR